MSTFSFKQIGTIHSPYHDTHGMPIQPPGAKGTKGTVELLPEYEEALSDLEGFSHLILLYVFHRTDRYIPLVTPFMDSKPRGLFSTRAPKRPNPIGISIVKLVKIDKTTLHVENIDVLDKTPLLDVKPYVPEFDLPSGDVRTGWLEQAKGLVEGKKADGRFESEEDQPEDRR
ncbi:MAG: tRNA (N6-threonylcarbamoyladenosine(37)-N6)-methyltransferase TrmO [Spirochaetes bacterium]|nr:tRNA (N6-threonylcarbamoyladenosine(37)-N6)-methyltransferase TrmO [Spirochaetota bacterium]